MKRLVLILLTFVACTISVFAAKSDGKIYIVTQPDGTTLKVRLLGDEHFSWYQTSDGVLLKKVNKAFYIAETTFDGTLENTGILAHDCDKRSEKELAAVSLQNKTAFFSVAWNSLGQELRNQSAEVYPASCFCPHSGTVHVPIILMNYPDVPFTFNDQSVWEEYFNGIEFFPYTSDTRFKGYGSIASYFREASFGNLDFVFDIYGPYTADNEHDYYGSHRFSLLSEAVSKANSVVDFSQYDSNGDGNVDMVYVLYAGTGANLSHDDNDFWPACWYSSSPYMTADDMGINIIGGANELLLTAEQNNGTAIRAGIGVTCHEISHGLGLPDLYWTSSTDPTDSDGNVDWNNCGPEDWDLMDGGENIYNAMWPCQYAAWEREVLGWMSLEELTEPTDVTVYPLNTDKGKAFMVTNPANEYEYYVIENLMHSNKDWNYYLCAKYGAGLMITHVNTTKNGLSMAPNNNYGKPNVTILPADGFILASYSIGETIMYQGSMQEITRNMFFADANGDPYVSTKYEGTPITSLAEYKNYKGDEMIEKYPITDITRNDDGSISFKFMGGSEAAAIKTINANIDNAGTYNLQGQKVSGDYKGIIILNGKKILR